ncbi:MAG: polyphosphate kinase 1 [Bacteroidota bacterium]
MINRELSWLSFNERVLQEAENPGVPLIERFRFLGIYSNNMDEFFRVRVSTVRRMLFLKKNKGHSYKIEGFDGDADKLLEEIRKKVIKQQVHFELCYENLIGELEKKGVYQLREDNLIAGKEDELHTYFHTDLKHVIVPIILKSNSFVPKLRDKSIYLAVKMHTGKKPLYALVEIPPHYPRFYHFKSSGRDKKQYFILIDDIIRLNLDSIFSVFEYKQIEAYTFKFTRDAELDLDDDLSVSFIEKIEKSLKNRKKGIPVRFVYDQLMPIDLQHFLVKSLNLTGGNAIPGGRYHNFKDFSRFPDFGKSELVYPELEPLPHPDLDHKGSLIKTILEKDVLLHFPYQSFDHVVDVLREAAIDPWVRSIKINVYRVAKDSRILNALMNAVSNGKEVVVFFELQARFDEENNITWAERLKEHGARVIYGFNELKVHSKLFQINRLYKNQEQNITYIGTGNFHEKTARVYSDLGLLTSRDTLGEEVNKVFRILENSLDRGIYKQLMVSPFNSRRKLYALIRQEVLIAKSGRQGMIRIKVNNLVDAAFIDKLYHASRAGVKIQLIVRGVCCLVPGLKGKSENIEVISIVGRFLEHTRFFIFNNDGKPKYYITSADLMERNLDKRIEVGVPILNNHLKEEIQAIFDMQWADNQKARIIDKKQKNKFRKEGNGIHNSQDELYAYYRRKEIKN